MRLAAGVTKNTFPVVVTSYEIVIADVKALQRYPWKYIVVDEGHRLKNFNCKLLRELRTIPTANKLLLSGAPAGSLVVVMLCFCDAWLFLIAAMAQPQMFTRNL